MDESYANLNLLDSNDFLLIFEDYNKLDDFSSSEKYFHESECNISISSQSNYSNTEIDSLYHDCLLFDNSLNDLLNFNDNITIANNTKYNDIIDNIENNFTKSKKRRKMNENNYNHSNNSYSICTILISNYNITINNFLLSSNINDLSKLIYDTMDMKCLVRFKIHKLSARTGPQNIIDYFILLKKAFPNIIKRSSKFKELMIDNFHIIKSKVILCGTESTYDDTFNFFSQSFNIEDINYLIDRKNNFIPYQYCMEVICTRYFDIVTSKIVLCDVGFRIKSQIAIDHHG